MTAFFNETVGFEYQSQLYDYIVITFLQAHCWKRTAITIVQTHKKHCDAVDILMPFSRTWFYKRADETRHRSESILHKRKVTQIYSDTMLFRVHESRYFPKETNVNLNKNKSACKIVTLPMLLLPSIVTYSIIETDNFCGKERQEED